MGLLDGGIQSLFGAAFSGLYPDGVLTRLVITEDGQGGGSSVETTQPCKVQTDACTQAMREQPGYTSTDVRLLILQAGITGGKIDTDCQVTDGRGNEYKIAWVGQDPAQAYWECRGTPA
jgi:hypothetical protein